MKLAPMAHQTEGLEKSFRKKFFAYLCEQGTGKTYMTLAEAEDYWTRGWIEALLIIAPKGVHTNWVLREIPRHLSAPRRVVAWERTKRFRKSMDDLHASNRRELKIFSINIDAINTAAGYAEADRFLSGLKTMMVVDESWSIKGESSKRTARVINLGRKAPCRRILNGTPITNAPPDLFSQFEFLLPERMILGHASYRSFVQHYAHTLSPTTSLVRHIAARTKGKRAPLVIAKDSRGRPMWRNLDELRRRILEHSYRVRKKDCLDLPEKIYTNHYFELGPKARRAYDQLSEGLPVEWNGEELPTKEEGRLMKLQEVASGFMLDGDRAVHFEERCPKLDALMGLLGMDEEPTIVWAYFDEEFRQIEEMMRKEGTSFLNHRAAAAGDRDRVVDAFQDGAAQVFLGSAASAGVGLTLTRAARAIYYTNTFNLLHRMQSEDRCHRIGTVRPVVYIDLVAPRTINESVARTLQAKKGTAHEVVDGEASG